MGESAFSATDFSNCQMRKKKRSTLLFIFILGGGEGEGSGSVSAVAANMKNLCVDLENVDMYIFFLLIVVYI